MNVNRPDRSHKFDPDQSHEDGATQPLEESEPRSDFQYDLPAREGHLKQTKKRAVNPESDALTVSADQSTVEPTHGRPSLLSDAINEAAVPGAPPREIISPIVLTRRSYRALAHANAPTTGASLVAQVRNYESHPEFARRMAIAGQHTANELRDLVAQGSVNPSAVQALLTRLGGERRAIALALTPDAEGVSDYGRPLRPEEWTEDVITNNASDRHFAFFARAAQWANRNMQYHRETGRYPKPYIDVVVSGNTQRVPLAFPVGFFNRSVRIFHPTAREARPMVDRAYELLSEALTYPALSEEAVMRRLGEAHYLLMQAQPFRRGTPSIVETFIDAALHVRCEVELPSKRENIEPFWEAIFTPGSLLSAYASNFRNFFE